MVLNSAVSVVNAICLLFLSICFTYVRSREPISNLAEWSPVILCCFLFLTIIALCATQLHRSTERIELWLLACHMDLALISEARHFL